MVWPRDAKIENVTPMMLGGSVMTSLGLLAFVGAFIGFVGRFGAVPHRAAEVEGMMQGVQERLEEMR